MDRWSEMDGWIVGWKGGWKDRWISGMDEWISGESDGRMDG